MATATTGEDLVTTGQLTREFGVSLFQLNYALTKSGIEPVQRAGIVRLFSRGQLEKIRAAIEATSKRHGGGQ